VSYRLSWTPQWTNASMLCLLKVVANPHHTGEAYSNLARTTAWVAHNKRPELCGTITAHILYAEIFPFMHL